MSIEISCSECYIYGDFRKKTNFISLIRSFKHFVNSEIEKIDDPTFCMKTFEYLRFGQKMTLSLLDGLFDLNNRSDSKIWAIYIINRSYKLPDVDLIKIKSDWYNLSYFYNLLYIYAITI